MAKTLRQILEVAEPKAGDEKRFKDKHVVQKTRNPAYKDEAEEDAVYQATNVKKDKTKKSGDHTEGDDAKMYEAKKLQSFYNTELDEEEKFIPEGVVDTLKKIQKTRKEMQIKFKNGQSMDVDPKTAGMLMDVHKQLNSANARKFQQSLERGQDHFMKMVDFAGSVA
jgi:hypothetical protein